MIELKQDGHVHSWPIDASCDCGVMISEFVQEQAKEIKRLQKQLSDAAHEMPCAGSIAHRIRVLRETHRETAERLDAEIERLEVELGRFREAANSLLNEIATASLDLDTQPLEQAIGLEGD